MDISVSGKHVDVGDALRSHIEEQLDGAVTKYFEQALDATVTVSREGGLMHVDITVHPGPRGMIVQGNGELEDPYAAFDYALERIKKQLRRYKRRLNDHHRHSDEQHFLSAQQYVIQPEAEDNEVGDDAQPIIVAEMLADIATLTVSEAVMRMDLADAPVMMFKNSKTGTLNVVYHRKDGNIGWIDPVPAAAAE